MKIEDREKPFTLLLKESQVARGDWIGCCWGHGGNDGARGWGEGIATAIASLGDRGFARDSFRSFFPFYGLFMCAWRRCLRDLLVFLSIIVVVFFCVFSNLGPDDATDCATDSDAARGDDAGRRSWPWTGWWPRLRRRREDRRHSASPQTDPQRPGPPLQSRTPSPESLELPAQRRHPRPRPWPHQRPFQRPFSLRPPQQEPPCPEGTLERRNETSWPKVAPQSSSPIFFCFLPEACRSPKISIGICRGRVVPAPLPASSRETTKHHNDG